MQKRNFFKAVVVSLLAAATIGSPAFADTSYPVKPIRVIVPYAAGGISDLVARIIGDKVSAYWGQQFVVENKPGAGGTVGLETAVREADKGHTILIGTSSEVTINPAFKPGNTANAAVRTIGIITSTPMVLIASKNAGYSDWQGFVKAAQAASDPLAFSSAGNGTITHIAGEAVALAAGSKLLHVAYNGGAPAVLATVSGEVPLGVATVSTALQHIKDGTAVALAVTSAKRFPALPDVPTVEELTGKPFDYAVFVHLTVPKDTDANVEKVLTEGVAKALAESDVKKRLTDLANVEEGLYGAAAQQRVDQDREKAAAVIKTAGITLE